MFLVFEVHGDPGSSPVSLKERLNACEDLEIVSDLNYPYNLISIVPHIVIIFIYFCFQPHWIFGLMFFFGGVEPPASLFCLVATHRAGCVKGFPGGCGCGGCGGAVGEIIEIAQNKLATSDP